MGIIDYLDTPILKYEPHKPIWRAETDLFQKGSVFSQWQQREPVWEHALCFLTERNHLYVIVHEADIAYRLWGFFAFD